VFLLAPPQIERETRSNETLERTGSGAAEGVRIADGSPSSTIGERVDSGAASCRDRPMTAEHYAIRGGVAGRERLRVLARVMWPTTRTLFDRVGVTRTAQCLDAGCGGGDVTVELARIAPDGRVVGTDVDEAKLALGRAEAAEVGIANVTFRSADVMQPPSDGAAFDLVYARFLLSHLPDPQKAVTHLAAQLAVGGTLVVEDIDFRGHFCHPDSPAFWRYVDLYTRAVSARGADPNIGPRLPGLLQHAGLDAVGMNVIQPAGFEGEVKLISPITLEAIAGAVTATGLATAEEIEQTASELYAFAARPDSVLSIPRVVQAWGRRAA
jgi:SAM-dependent methyltransferase